MPGAPPAPGTGPIEKGLVAVATFKHNRYPQLQLHDGDRVWAQFRDGLFETTDAEVVKRLRNADDKDLVEVKPERKAAGDTKREKAPAGDTKPPAELKADQNTSPPAPGA